MNTGFWGFLVDHGIAAGGWLLCIYRQREQIPRKEKVGSAKVLGWQVVGLQPQRTQI
jgi:hypothetical protein